MKIRRDDNVLVIAGKNRGKRGRVHRVYPEGNRVVVEGVNIIKRHTKPTGTVRQAGIVEREAPIHVSNVMLICTKCNQPARIGFRVIEGGGKARGSKVRICSSCHEVID